MRTLGVVSGVGAMAVITACGNGTVEPSAAGPSSGEAVVMCFWGGTEPPPDRTSSGCPEEPSASPSPAPVTVVMTPHWERTYGWRNPACSPRRPAGVTRHGTELRCDEGEEGGEGEEGDNSGNEWNWRWRFRPHQEMPCVDAGEWHVMSSGWGLVCRDGTWRRERLDDSLSRPREPSPSKWPSQGPGKIPNPRGIAPDDPATQKSH
ncbi:hypothetical protein ACWGIY_25305 [Streptomyces sp. NPDC054878]